MVRNLARSWVGGALALAFGLGTGCEVDEVPAVELDEAEVRLQGLLCERPFRCTCGGARAYSSIDECKEYLGLSMARLHELEGQLTYDAECMGRYVEFLDELGCSPVLAEPASCQRPCLLMYGEAREDEPCEMFNNQWVSDCAQGLLCVSGRCVDVCPVLPVDGEPCESFSCAEGHYCEPTTEVCAILPEPGEECARGMCAGSAVCEWDDPADPTSTRRCVAPRELGAPCTAYEQCASGYCPAGACAPLPLEGESCAGTEVCAPALECRGEVCVAAPPILCSMPVPDF